MNKRLPAALLGTVAVMVCALLLTRLDYVPIWDGRIYAACVSAAAERFTLESLRCAGHTSEAYVAVAGAAQMLAPSSAVPVLATNATLFLLACVAFHRLVRLAFPGLPALDRALLSSAFALQPAFLSAVVQPGLDLPLLPGLLWAIVFMLEERWTPLVLTGLAMAFTKETGVLLYAVLLSCYALWFELRPRRPLRDRVARVLLLAPLAIPGVAFAAYLAIKRLANPDRAVLWYTGTTGDSLAEQFLIPRLNLYQVNYAVLLLVLNFAWIVAGTIAADAFVGAVRAAHRELPRPVEGADRRTVSFLVLLTVATGYALTRFTTFGHTRYFLPVYALLFFPFCGALLRLGIGTAARRAVLGGYAVLLLASVTRTVDPVSRRLYGTFEFGSHSMLRMTRVTGECCAFGQDQLAYSLEFTVIQELMDSTFSAPRARRERVVVVPDSTSWIFLDPLSAGERRFTRRDEASAKPVVLEHREVVRGSIRPDSAAFLALPYGDNRRAIREMERSYDFRDERRVERGGYSLPTYRLVLRQAAQP